MLSFGAKRPRHTTRSRPRSSVSPGGCCPLYSNRWATQIAICSDDCYVLLLFLWSLWKGTSCSITMSCSTIEENTFCWTQTKWHQLYQNKVLMFLSPDLYHFLKDTTWPSWVLRQPSQHVCYVVIRLSHPDSFCFSDTQLLTLVNLWLNLCVRDTASDCAEPVTQFVHAAKQHRALYTPWHVSVLIVQQQQSQLLRLTARTCAYTVWSAEVVEHFFILTVVNCHQPYSMCTRTCYVSQKLWLPLWS